MVFPILLENGVNLESSNISKNPDEKKKLAANVGFFFFTYFC